MLLPGETATASEHVTRNAAGRDGNSLRSADGATQMAESREQLKNLLEESEKASLKLNIKKHSDHGIRSRHSMADRRGRGKQWQTPFLGSRVTQPLKVDGDCPWKEGCDRPGQSAKRQRRHFANKDAYSQGCGLPSSHRRLGKLSCEEGRAPKD